jgi:hypothetical protein
LRYLKYSLVLILLGFLFASCEKEDSSVIDPIKNFPVIVNASVSPAVYDTSNINGIAWAQVSSVDPVQKVTATIKNPFNAEIGSFELKDDGTAPDTTAGDGKYACYFSFSMTCRIVGSYKTEFIAVTTSSLSSGLNIQNFSVVNNNNQKPVIVSWIVPDDVQIPSGIGSDTSRPVFMQIKVEDPDGQCDLPSDGSFFNSFNPSGIPNAFNPFTMYDDGVVDAFSRCDTVANDGKYSRRLYIFPTASTGNYTFKFNAKDNAQNLRDTLIRTINVHP